MMFTELFVPRAMFDEDRLQRLALRLTANELYAPDDFTGREGRDPEADPGVMALLEDLTHVVVHEVGTWVAGGRSPHPAGAPHLLVRVHVPGPWRKDLSEHLITAIDEVLTRDDGTGHPQAHTEVHVLGVPEGGYGLAGRVVGESGLLTMINDAKREDAEAPPGMAIDPTCGTVLPLEDATVTLERDGRTHVFCCPGCRRHFVDHVAEAGAR